jgi:hypothetical protein
MIKLQKTFYYTENKREIYIEFIVSATREYDELDDKEDVFLDFDSIEIVHVFDEEKQEEIILDNILEIIEDFVEKNYKKLVREAKNDFLE